MDFNKTIDGIVKRVPNPIEETYMDEDGFLRCKKCGGKRESILSYRDRVSKVPCICECQKKIIENEREAEKRREKMRKVQELKQTGFSSKQMINWTFENNDGSQPRVFHIAKKYVENFAEMRSMGKGLLFHGDVGAGKTYVAACIANALTDKGIPVMMTNFARIANKLQERFDKRQSYLDSLSKFDLLVLDDLAAERSTEYMQEIVYTVIDERCRSGLPMIITTNLSIEAIKNPQNTNDSRIYDRILEKCFPVEVIGDSHRRKNINDEYENMRGLLGLN